ncbi:hypothetical protein AC579_10587 [Pseudocercospora musae]|uniref:Uncharacterized protein n=1 Tax=Pseudocercospora musae TaxID=113226 RepID=A0A139ILC3_9PEZI|nr:hypothetical protein AC579_10587 [Pseudocercospora musae]
MHMSSPRYHNEITLTVLRSTSIREPQTSSSPVASSQIQIKDTPLVASYSWIAPVLVFRKYSIALSLSLKDAMIRGPAQALALIRAVAGNSIARLMCGPRPDTIPTMN